MQTEPGTDMICGIIRPEDMSRPEGTAMQTKPGTDMICDMIRPEGTSRPVGTAIQTKPGTDMIRPEGMSRPKGAAMSLPEMAMPGTGMICKPEGMSRPVDTAMQTEPGTDMAPLAAASAQDTLPSRQQVFSERGVATCDVGQLFKPPKGSSAQSPAAAGAPRCSKRARYAAAPSTGV